MHLYTGDNADTFRYSGRAWPQMGFVDLLHLINPCISTNARRFFSPAEEGRTVHGGKHADLQFGLDVRGPFKFRLEVRKDWLRHIH